jgi:hypothetical protein
MTKTTYSNFSLLPLSLAVLNSSLTAPFVFFLTQFVNSHHLRTTYMGQAHPLTSLGFQIIHTSLFFPYYFVYDSHWGQIHLTVNSSNLFFFLCLSHLNLNFIFWWGNLENIEEKWKKKIRTLNFFAIFFINSTTLKLNQINTIEVEPGNKFFK